MMRICASVGEDRELSSPDIDSADMLELRLDLLGAWPSEVPDKPILATLRGDADPASLRGMQALAVRKGATLLDLEEGVPLLVDKGRTGIVRSYHDWTGTPDPAGMTDIMERLEGDVVKTAFMASSLRDLVSMHTACRGFTGPHVVLGMGDMGKVTRIRQNVLGNEFTFASVGDGTAPGQMSVRRMRELGDDCMVTGILGHPLSHSLSPAMHDAAFRSLGIRGIYLPFDVRDPEDLTCLPEVMTGYDIRGLNVTIPYKVRCMDVLDALDDEAESIGAVNTIVNDGGVLRGTNTDAKGLEGAFRISGTDISGKRALILGAGGAARAAAVFLSRNGCPLSVAARDSEKGKTFAHGFDASFQEMKGIRGDDFDVIINCTPLGMKGFPSVSPLDPAQLRPDHVVMDMVYEPRETPLIAHAVRAGAEVVHGIDMLVSQARESFVIWTGEDPGHDAMREAVG